MNTDFDAFVSQLRSQLTDKAVSKGYASSLTPDPPPSPTFTFIRDNFGHHALGEIVMKCLRYKSRGNLEDLIKIAAWAFLEWRRELGERRVESDPSETC